MFAIGYLKSSKKIVYAKYDGAVNAEIPTPQQQLELHCEMNNLNVDDYVAVELPFDKKLNIVLGNHVFNESTGKIEEDPNYVVPEPEPTPTV